jgi:hypothetical protein
MQWDSPFTSGQIDIFMLSPLRADFSIAPSTPTLLRNLFSSPRLREQISPLLRGVGGLPVVGFSSSRVRERISPTLADDEAERFLRFSSSRIRGRIATIPSFAEKTRKNLFSCSHLESGFLLFAAPERQLRIRNFQALA